MHDLVQLLVQGSVASALALRDRGGADFRPCDSQGAHVGCPRAGWLRGVRRFAQAEGSGLSLDSCPRASGSWCPSCPRQAHSCAQSPWTCAASAGVSAGCPGRGRLPVRAGADEHLLPGAFKPGPETAPLLLDSSPGSPGACRTLPQPACCSRMAVIPGTCPLVSQVIWSSPTSSPHPL